MANCGLLLEDGSFLLKEDIDMFLLENETGCDFIPSLSYPGDFGSRHVAERQPAGQFHRKRFNDMKAAALAAEAVRLESERIAKEKRIAEWKANRRALMDAAMRSFRRNDN
jgi:hypothetical protein